MVIEYDKEIVFKRLSDRKIEVRYKLPIYVHDGDHTQFLTYENVKFTLKFNNHSNGYVYHDNRGNIKNINRISFNLAIKKKNFHINSVRLSISNNEETCVILTPHSITLYHDRKIAKKILDWKVKKRREKINLILK